MSTQDSSIGEAPLRSLIAASQIALGLLLLFDGLVFVTQAWINLHWEVGFYGEPSPLSTGMLGRAVILVCIGAGACTVGLAYAQLRISGQWLLFSSLILTCIVPEPIAWFLFAVNLLVLYERWTTLRREQNP